MGDRLLVQIAERLKTLMGDRNFIARLGGDEFVMLLTEIRDRADVEQFTRWLLKALQKPCIFDDYEVVLSGSVGVVLETEQYRCANEVIRDADIALYRSKRKGRNCYTVFDSAMREDASRRLQLENELRNALRNQEFVLHYQPIVSLKTGALKGFEALIRWQPPNQPLRFPKEFIAVAEETKLIVPLGWWVLREACQQLKTWQYKYPGLESCKVSVNISALQLKDSSFLDRIDHILKQIQISASNLVLELTESILVENFEATKTLFNALRQRSVHIGIDDFGTGYSSLSYLQNLPIHTLKIDQLFVKQLGENSKNQPIAETVVFLAQKLNLISIAEGIETDAQRIKLSQLGCDCGQGYWFARPLSVEDAERYIRSHLEDCA